MKKSLIALAALAAVGAASAQSSVTLFGIVDATLQVGRGSLTDVTRLQPNGYNSSRLGFRGTEDLGGGLAASFWLEAGFNPDEGTGQVSSTNNQAIPGTAPTVRPGSQGIMFNRRSTVSLSGGFGELRLGRDYTPHFWNHTVFDAFGTNGVGASIVDQGIRGPAGTRASNSIGYFLPANLGGIYGQAQYYMGENPEDTPTEDDGRGASIRLGYAAGPINVAAAYGKTDFAAGDVKSANIGGSYDFGLAKLLALYSQDEAGAVEQKGFLIGTLVPVGAGEIRASFGQTKTDGTDNKSRKLALGYVHNLSKRTAVYTTVARVKNDGANTIALGGSTTAAGTNSTGFDLGLRHSF